MHALLDRAIDQSDCTVLVLGAEASHQIWLAREIDRTLRVGNPLAAVDLQERRRTGALQYLLPPGTPVYRWADGGGGAVLARWLRESLEQPALSASAAS